MHIITSEGKIVEGQELTAEEAVILAELIETGISEGAGAYIATSSRQGIARYLVANFKLTRRQQPAETAAEAIEREMPALAQPDAAPSTDDKPF